MASKRKAYYERYLCTGHWKSLREKAFKRDGYKCKKCGSGRHLQGHHKRYRANLRDCTVDDIETICKRCHRKHHKEQMDTVTTAELRKMADQSVESPTLMQSVILGIIDKLEALEGSNVPCDPKRGRAQSIEEVKLFCAKSGISDGDAEWFWNKMGAAGWRNGGKPVRDWQKLLISWRMAGYLASQLQRVATKSNAYGIKLAMDALQEEANELKRKYTIQVADGVRWQDESKRLEYLAKRDSYKDLRSRMGASA